MKAVKKKLWTGWIRIQKILTEKDGISTVELILVLVENLALYIACLEGEKSLKNKLYVRHTQ
jgi:hypothetical protein